VPGFVKVSVCTALIVPTVADAKVRTAGEIMIPEVGAIPVPLNATIWGEPVALSAMVIEPVRLPAAVGVNVTEIVQLAPIAKVAPQVCVCAKSPDAAIEAMVSTAVPELVKVNVWAELVVPSVCEAKVRLVAESVAVGTWACPVAVPLREILCVA
jgi:hypothetical protein